MANKLFTEVVERTYMLLSVNKKKSIHCIMKSKYLMTLYYPLCQYAVGVEKIRKF